MRNRFRIDGRRSGGKEVCGGAVKAKCLSVARYPIRYVFSVSEHHETFEVGLGA
jgi:hypothetical protein